jgi:integrase
VTEDGVPTVNGLRAEQRPPGRHIAEVLHGIRRQHGRPPDQKEAVLADDLLRTIKTLDRDLRGLRDRAILLLGFAGGLRRRKSPGSTAGPARPIF